MKTFIISRKLLMTFAFMVLLGGLTAQNAHHDNDTSANSEMNAQNFRAAAESGNAEAQFNLGNCYYDGLGVEVNVVDAISWYSRAADQNYAPAQNALGKAYENGDMGTPDLKLAKKFYTLAANQGNLQAMYNLGRNSVDGFYNYTTDAVRWFAKSAGGGYAPAMFELGFCYEHGYGVKVNRAIALEWYIKSQQGGYEEAKEAVARLGEGSQSDSE
ncbi:MAG: sel1 repeat family protein [Bacteroidales bacterium]|jgi:TPR repeat protein|nr:sel1 repeat family protein [Bacteroidales bacterium]